MENRGTSENEARKPVLLRTHLNTKEAKDRQGRGSSQEARHSVSPALLVYEPHGHVWLRQSGSVRE